MTKSYHSNSCGSLWACKDVIGFTWLQKIFLELRLT